ncbi:MAG: ABC transporter substrate-binding protein [Burkholderiales bacterium]|nr:ABC transporter substrate-binding protein [Flavobacterium sp.]
MLVKKLIDQLGTLHTFGTSPKRIISLVPSQTELLYDLGLENRIVGITKFCVHPYQFRSTKKIVGGTKKIHFEKIRLLLPDIILCNKEENTLEMVEALSQICPVWVTDIKTIDDNFKMIADFGQIFDCRIEAQKWCDKLTFACSEFATFIENKPIQKVVYFIWKNPYMVVGTNNYINEVLKLNHFQNLYDREERYPIVELNTMGFPVDADLILLSSEPFPFREEDAFEIGRFTHHAKTVFVDGEMFSWYGSRLLRALAYFKKLHQQF